MRIGMVTACYKPVINGVTRMVELYKQRLEAQGHEVTIFTLGEPDPAGEEPGVVRSPALPVGNDGYYISMRYTREAQLKLREMEIIHCHHLFMSVEMAHRYGRCPIVYTNHTRYDLYTGSYMPLPQPAADAIMRQIWPEFTSLADVVITPSESVRRIMLAFGVKRPIKVIENGIDLRPFRRPASPFTKQQMGLPETAVVFIYVGRLSPEKNLDLLLEQFRIAREVVPEAHLFLVGRGTLQDELTQYAHQLELAEHVHFTGPVAYEDVANYLAMADGFVTASVTEVHPLTIIEAMAAGLPVAASVSPGIVDTVEADSGLLTAHLEGGLAAGMVGLALDEERRRRMGEAAARASQRYDIERTVAKTVALYEQLREERPDLERDRAHGRWISNRERIQPLLDQLSRLIRPPEKIGTGPLRRWMTQEPEDENGYGEW